MSGAEKEAEVSRALLERLKKIADTESKMRKNALSKLSSGSSRGGRRVYVRLSPEASSILAEAMKEDSAISTISGLINKIIIEWHTMKSELNVNLSGLEKEVADLEKKLEKINGWLDLLEKRLIKITARAGAVLIKGGK